MNKKKRIAFWFRYGPAEHSELFHAIPRLLESLSQSHEVHYYGMRTTAPIPEIIQQSVILHFLPFKVERKLSSDKFFKTFLWIACLPFVAMDCKLRGIRAVYIDETIPFAAFLARIFFGKRVAITVADFFVDIYFTGWLAPFGRFIRAIDLWSWKRLPLIFTRAKSTGIWLTQKGFDSQRIHTVYDPCEFNVFYPATKEQRKAIRQQMGYQPSDVVLVHHGILHPNKGNDFIIQAISEIRHELPTLRFLLIGDGPEANKLKALIDELGVGDICKRTGWLETLPEVAQALNAGDIGLVMRTGGEADNFHMTGALVHSMACGLPILSARLSGVAEVIKEERNGLFFAPGNKKEFQQKLSRLVKDEALRQKYGLAAYEDAKGLFDPDVVIKNTIEPLIKLAE